MALPVVTLLLALVLAAGAVAMRGAQQQIRAARQARAYAEAFEAAQAALRDAEADIERGTRAFLFGRSESSPFAPGVCGRSGVLLGLCQGAPGSPPIWLVAGLDDVAAHAPGVPFGTFTGRRWPDTLREPPPRYVIEALPDIVMGAGTRPIRYLYRITAAGHGAGRDAAVYLQVVYRKRPADGDADTLPIPAGRLSWREIVTWQEMRAAATSGTQISQLKPTEDAI